MPHCTPCDRWFPRPFDLKRHLQTSSSHEYCHPCQRAFNSSQSYKSHLTNSSSHHICQLCPEGWDFRELEEWQDHMTEEHCYCWICHEQFATDWALKRHDSDVHNMCEQCGRYFESISNLKQVSQTSSSLEQRFC